MKASIKALNIAKNQIINILLINLLTIKKGLCKRSGL